MTEAEKAYQYFVIAVPENEEQTKAYFWARKALQPTLAQPNEWVSMETPPTEQGWYHVAILDLKTGKYKVEQDLYAIGLAKIYGFEPGFCKANRWEERERIDYWCKFPSPPVRRPPEGEA